MKTHNKAGFSLIELLVALSILAVVAAIIVPRFLNVRNSAAQTTATAQLSELKSAYNKFISLGGTPSALTGATAGGEVLQYLSQAATVGTARTKIGLGSMVDSAGNFGSTVIGLPPGMVPAANFSTTPTATSAQGWYISGASGTAAGTAYYCDGSTMYTLGIDTNNNIYCSAVTGALTTAPTF